jgi:DNA gyrase/topoisomerase IV subunit B
LVRVHDGGVWMAPVIAALCNQAYQLEVLSTGPDLLVRLSARSPNPGQGFKATFEFESTSDDLQHLDPKQSGTKIKTYKGWGKSLPSFIWQTFWREKTHSLLTMVKSYDKCDIDHIFFQII